VADRQSDLTATPGFTKRPQKKTDKPFASGEKIPSFCCEQHQGSVAEFIRKFATMLYRMQPEAAAAAAVAAKKLLPLARQMCMFNSCLNRV
jgi:hypothetical protein